MVLNGLEKWPGGNLMKFDTAVQSPEHQEEKPHAPGQAGTIWLGNSFVEKELRSLVGKKWDIIQQSALAVQKANSLLSWIKQCCQQVKGGNPCPLLSPGENVNTLEGWVKRWAPHCHRGVVSLETAWQRLKAFMQGDTESWECPAWSRNGSEWFLQCVKRPDEGTKEEGARLFRAVSRNKTRGNRYHVKYGNFHWNKENLCTVTVVGHWHRVPREAKESAALKVLKIQADTALSNLLRLTCSGQGLDHTISWGTFLPQPVPSCVFD